MHDDSDRILADISKRAEEQFRESQAVLSFDAFISEVIRKPRWHIRNCAQYFVDMVDSFGAYDVPTAAKNLKRYKLFDADFLEKEGCIFGQERFNMRW